MDVLVIFGFNGEIVGCDMIYLEVYQEIICNIFCFVEVLLLLGYEWQWGKFWVGVNVGVYFNVFFVIEGVIYFFVMEEFINFGQQGDCDVLFIFEWQVLVVWYAGMSLVYNLYSCYSLIVEFYFKIYF